MEINYGLKIDEVKQEDYKFGYSLPYLELQPDGDWTQYLPKPEYQRLFGLETYACVTFTVLSCVEILIKKQYGEEVNFSDRFLAAISGTKNGGNSPKTVCQFLRKLGVVPEEMWPFDKNIDSWEKFYEPLPDKLKELAKEFNENWDFKYELVPSNDKEIIRAIKCSPLGVSVAAWYPRGSMYYKPENTKENHFVALYKVLDTEYKRIFDSYDSFTKDVEWNTKHSVIQRYYIKKRIKAQEYSWFYKLLEKVAKIWYN